MNIFYLDHDPKLAAEYHCDKHVIKMILESAQLLSTAHRVLDGVEGRQLSKAGRNLKHWVLNDWREVEFYKATHVNHPSAVWVRQSITHYEYLVDLSKMLCNQYTLRYNKYHACTDMIKVFDGYQPDNIAKTDFQPPPQCMPDHCKHSDPVTAYRQYYTLEKSDIAEWRYTPKPYWYK